MDLLTVLHPFLPEELQGPHCQTFAAHCVLGYRLGTTNHCRGEVYQNILWFI